jgi:hypothetical protein
MPYSSETVLNVNAMMASMISRLDTFAQPGWISMESHWLSKDCISSLKNNVVLPVANNDDLRAATVQSWLLSIPDKLSHFTGYQTTCEEIVPQLTDSQLSNCIAAVVSA